MVQINRHAQVLKTKGRSFYLASRLMGQPYRKRATLLYAFCRHLDDLVDEEPNKAIAKAKIEQLRTMLISGNSTDSVVLRLNKLINSIDVPVEVVNTLIEGVESDLALSQIKSEAELLQYAYRVAGTVGLMMSHILDVKDQAALSFAIDLGIAMQLTNIARDVGEDARLGRVYIPASWLPDSTPQSITNPSPAEATVLSQATQRILLLAERYYRSGNQGLHFLPLKSRFSITVASILYSEIGKVIKQQGYCSYKSRAVVGPIMKFKCVMQGIMKVIVYAMLPKKKYAHSSELHTTIRSFLMESNAINTA